MSKPLLIVITAPSGAGKSTLCDRLLLEFDNIVYSISCTTRSPRGEEVDSEDYFFLTEDQFKKKIDKGLFLEHATVHGYRYGTLKSTVNEAMAEGNSVIMDIDVQGARQIRSVVEDAPDGDVMKEGFIDIFITPPSIEELRDRLVCRGEDSPEAINIRMKNAVEEMNCEDEFRFVVVNDELELAYNKLRDLIDAAMN